MIFLEIGLALGDFDILAGFPKAMNIAEGDGHQCARFLEFHRNFDFWLSIKRTFIGTLDGFAMASETEFSYHVGKFAGFRLEIDFNPINVMFGGVWVGNFFANFERNDKFFTGLDLSGAFDDRCMFFSFPICGLKIFTNRPLT